MTIFAEFAQILLKYWATKVLSEWTWVELDHSFPRSSIEPWIAAGTPNEHFIKKKDFARIRAFGEVILLSLANGQPIRGSSVWEAVIELNSSSFW